MDPLYSLLARSDLASRPLPGETLADAKARAEASLLDVSRRALAGTQLMGASFQDAQDAAQEAVIALWLALEQGEPITDADAWARTVAVRHFYRRMRTTRRNNLALEREITDLDAIVASPADEVPDLVTGREQVLSLLRALPGKQQEAMALYIDGFPLAEIALSLDTTPATAMSLVRLARTRLREIITAQADGESSAGPAAMSRATPARTREDRTGDDELLALPPRQREVLRLSREGYKPAQIAEALSLPPNTVRVNLYHARKRVRLNRELPSSPAA